MKYWYYDIQNEDSEEIEGNGKLDEIINDFYYLSEEEGSFFGLENNENEILQFAWSHDKWIADIPIPKENGSFQKKLNYDECVIHSMTTTSRIHYINMSRL